MPDENGNFKGISVPELPWKDASGTLEDLSKALRKLADQENKNKTRVLADVDIWLDEGL